MGAARSCSVRATTATRATSCASGSVRVTHDHTDGRTITLAELRPGRHVRRAGDVRLGAPLGHRAGARGDEALALLAGDMRRMLLSHPHIAVNMLAWLAERLRNANDTDRPAVVPDRREPRGRRAARPGPGAPRGRRRRGHEPAARRGRSAPRRPRSPSSPAPRASRRRASSPASSETASSPPGAGRCWCMTPARFGTTSTDSERERQRMVEHQLRRRGITDECVLARDGGGAARAVPAEGPRRRRLPRRRGRHRRGPDDVAAVDRGLHDRAARAAAGDETVLEVGTGSGYAAAVLSRCARAGRHDRAPRAARRPGARATLAELGYDNVEVRVGDGTKGAPGRRAVRRHLGHRDRRRPAARRRCSTSSRPTASLVCPVRRGVDRELLMRFDSAAAASRSCRCASCRWCRRLP